MAPQGPIRIAYDPCIIAMFLAGKFKPLKEHREHVSVKAQ